MTAIRVLVPTFGAWVEVMPRTSVDEVGQLQLIFKGDAGAEPPSWNYLCNDRFSACTRRSKD